MWNAISPGFELVSLCPIPATITITPQTPACVMKILRESCYAFVTRCWFIDFYFELFHRIFILFHIHMELFSVISMRCLLRPLIPIWPRNWCRVPATNPLAPISTAFMTAIYPSYSSSFFKIFIFTSFVLVALLHPAFYGIDNSTTKIFRFAFDKRTISGRRPSLDIVYG